MEVGEKTERERDGFCVTVQVFPDEDVRPGDDDVTPAVEVISWSEYHADQEERDEDGQFIRRPVVGTDLHGTPCRVSLEELDRLEQAGWGGHTYSQRRIRKLLREEAEAWIAGDRYYVGLIVRAERGGVAGEDALWGIDCDTRDPAGTDAYMEEIAGEMADEAISYAAAALLGGLAPLALSY